MFLWVSFNPTVWLDILTCQDINLPTCGLALVLLIFFLKLNRPKGQDLVTLRRSFDFIGLYVHTLATTPTCVFLADVGDRLIVMTGAALLIVGFSTAADDGFGAPGAYGVIAAGGVVCMGAIAHSLTTKKNAILPRVSHRVDRYNHYVRCWLKRCSDTSPLEQRSFSQ